MNRKLLIITGALATAVLAFGAASSGAWFTDSEKVQVDASSARLDIQLEVGDQGADGPCGDRVTVDGGLPLTWELSNLAPGDVRTRCINVQNKQAPESTLPVKYRYRAVNPTGDAGLLGANTSVYRGDCVTGDIANPVLVYSGPILGMTGGDFDGPGGYVGTDGAWNGQLPVQTTHCYKFVVAVPTSLGNGFQGLTGTVDIEVDATQVNNPAW